MGQGSTDNVERIDDNDSGLILLDFLVNRVSVAVGTELFEF
jgi:hypothetical protein